MNLRLFSAWLAVTCTLLMLSGCSSENTGKIEGTKWTNTAQMMDGQMIPAGIINLDFAKDGKLVFAAGPEVYKGTYKLSFGKTVVLNLDKPLSGSKTHHEKIEINGKTLKMTDSDGKSLSFKKI